VIDGLFAPIDALLCDFVTHAAPRRILDVGCGTGGTTVAVAKRLDGAANCLGVDISEAMVAAARARAAREQVVATFVTADAETHAFELTASPPTRRPRRRSTVVLALRRPVLARSWPASSTPRVEHARRRAV
jgi:tRNA/tmRNA/rRNA uracil-C5-methylase (TrmA/RlmC/RlmD family)